MSYAKITLSCDQLVIIGKLARNASGDLRFTNSARMLYNDWADNIVSVTEPWYNDDHKNFIMELDTIEFILLHKLLEWSINSYDRWWIDKGMLRLMRDLLQRHMDSVDPSTKTYDTSTILR